MKYIVYTDGGSRWNPGNAGCGVYLYSHDGSIRERRYRSIWRATNNIAEYTAAYLGISRAITLWAEEIELRADSELVIEQLKGNYKVKNSELKKIFLQIQELVGNWWGNIRYVHIPRAENTEADRLSNVAMDQGEVRKSEYLS